MYICIDTEYETLLFTLPCISQCSHDDMQTETWKENGIIIVERQMYTSQNF